MRYICLENKSVLTTIVSIFIIIQVFVISCAFTQDIESTSIAGRVIDSNTYEPLELVNVYISNTMIGGTTDDRGTFHLMNVPNYSFEIIVSRIGYATEKIQIDLTKDIKNSIEIELRRKIIELPGVVVKSDSRRRKKDLKLFTKYFIGSSINSKKTKILNSEVLKFDHRNKNVLIASASRPLRIVNKALGYKVTYFLESFESTPDHVQYSGVPIFEELDYFTPGDTIRWQSNRSKTYHGSLRHFLTVLCKNYSTPKAFSVNKSIAGIDWGSEIDPTNYHYPNKADLMRYDNFYFMYLARPVDSAKDPIRRYIDINYFLSKTSNPSEYILNFPKYLEVIYAGDKQNYYPVRSINFNNSPSPQSQITLETKSMILDNEGRYSNKYKIKTYGYWSNERVADMLPFEYLPD